MPIYEYQCEKCSHCFEHLALSSNEDSPKCPECESGETRRLMSASCILGTGSKSACGPSGAGKFS